MLFGLPLIVCVAACSGGTDTVTGTGSPGSSGSNGSGTGTADDEPKGGTSATDPSRDSNGKKNGPTQGDDPSKSSDPNDPDGSNDPSTPPPPSGVDGVIQIPQATATATSADFVLSQSKKTKRLDIASSNLTCPVPLSSTQAPYVYVQLENKGPKRALTSVWTSATTGGPSNTADALTIYPGATPPATDAAREQCLGSLSWSCSGSPCTGWPGLSSANGDAVEVPANGSVLVFVQGEAAKTGSFKLNVRTDFLQ